ASLMRFPPGRRPKKCWNRRVSSPSWQPNSMPFRIESRPPDWTIRLLCLRLQDLLSGVVNHRRFVARDFIVRVPEKLILAAQQALADRLLDPRVVQIALSRRFPRDELQYPIRLLAGNDGRHLARLHGRDQLLYFGARSIEGR